MSHHLPGVNLPVVSDQGSRLVARACPSFSRPRVVDLPVASVLGIAFSCPCMSQLFPSPIAHLLPTHVPAFAVPKSSPCPSLLSYYRVYLLTHVPAFPVTDCSFFSLFFTFPSSICTVLSFINIIFHYHVSFHLPTHVPVFSNDSRKPRSR